MPIAAQGKKNYKYQMNLVILKGNNTVLSFRKDKL